MTSDLAISSNNFSGAGNFGLMMPMGYADGISAFDGYAADFGNSPLGFLGLMMNPRQQSALFGQVGTAFHNYDTANILREDMRTLRPMAESIHQYRDPIWGKRWIEKSRVHKLLNIENDGAGDHKVAALYKLYCAMYGGLKNEKGNVDPYNIKLSDLKDPGLLIEQSKRLFAVTASQSRSKAIEQLTEVAVDGYNPELAAILLEKMAQGIGVDDKTVKAILVDSKASLESKGEGMYRRFITDVNAEYQKMTGGKTLDDYIHHNYSKTRWLKINVFGANAKGKQYLAALDGANQTTHHLSNPGTIFEMIGSPMGVTYAV